MKRSLLILAVLALLVGVLTATATPAASFDAGGHVLLTTHSFTWTDPASGGEVVMTENVYEGCFAEDGAFIPHDMTWEYVVDNLSYDPVPGVTNGFSGFQILFPDPVNELYAQRSPAIGGPWAQNAFSGSFPPFGVEWDVSLPDHGIMPGETGAFSFCTYERVDVVIDSAGAGSGPAGWGHSWGLEIPEPIVDADGSLSSGDGFPAAVEVAVGDPLTGWPTGADDEGLDWFDNDATCTWTFGDDLHVEGAAYPTALRNALHDQNDTFFDPVVLDWDGSFFDGQQVDVDLETGTTFTGCAGPDPVLKFFDANGATNWDDGEDIVLDLNLDGVFGEVLNTQVFLFHGPQSVPGELMFVLDLEACSDGHEICKKVKYIDDDRDGVIEVGELVTFFEVIQVHNASDVVWSDVTVVDRWGGQIDVLTAEPSVGTAVLTLFEPTQFERLDWDIGDLAPGETANLVITSETDVSPRGGHEFTQPGEWRYNGGAILRYFDGHRQGHVTPKVMLTVSP